jgi:hypothetical protein
MFNFAQDYRFVEVEHGYFAAAPRYSEPGDIAAIVQNLSIPVVLRQGPGHCCILIGACFIPGFVDGEAKDLLNSGQARLEEIRIS